MDSTQLIELVRAHVELYDLSHPKYLDVVHKEKLWQEIGRELNQTAPVCKSRWGNIRDNYRKNLKKIVTKSGHPTANIKRYKYSKQLSFLKKYLQEREISNLTCEESTRLNDECMKDTDQRENGEKETRSFQLTSDQDSEREDQGPSEEIDPIYIPENRSRKRSFSSAGSRPKRNSRYRKTETASATLMKYLVEKKEHDEKSSHKEPDAVDAFLACLAPTLRNLPAYYLNVAKTKIFSIVQEFELKAIVEAQKPTTTLTFSPSSSPPT